VTTTATPDVSVSIVLFDSSACLPDLIAALRAQTGVPFETFVIDNASRDADVARRQLADAQLGDVTWNAENVGYGRAHNQNLARFRGRYVVLLNPDVRFGADLLAHLVRFMDAHLDVAIAGPRVLEGVTRREFQPRRFYPGEGMVPLEPDLDRTEIGWLNGCCLIVRRSVLQALGGFDPDYFLYAEETDLCLRARRAGHRIGWCPNAEAHHLHLQSQLRSDADERSRRLFRGVATFWAKHYRPADVRRMAWFQLWTCRVLLVGRPLLAALARRWSVLAPERVRARRDVCRELMTTNGMRPASLGDLPVRIALRQLALLRRWLVHRHVPLDDY
jgi:GT2 family glycosyltransferase